MKPSGLKTHGRQVRVIRRERARLEFALSAVRRLSLVFRAKAAHLIRRAPRRWLRRARNRSRLLVIVRRACSSRSRHKSELRATQCCLESAGGRPRQLACRSLQHLLPTPLPPPPPLLTL